MRKRVVIIIVFVLVLIGNICMMLKVKERANAQEKEEQKAEPVKIKISAVGDIMLGRYVATLIKDNYDKPFEEVDDILQESDIRFGNLECVLSDGELENIKGKEKNFCLKGPSDMTNVLNLAGFDIVSLANNHIYDYAHDGLMDTVFNLEKSNIKTVGAGVDLQDSRKLEIIEVNNKEIGFLAYTDLAYVNFLDKTEIPAASEDKSGVAPLKEKYILEDLEKAKSECDLIFISLHWSDEYTHIPKDGQIELAHKIIDNGADGILGHHAHNLQGVEIYKGKPIIYNMGNFLFDQNDDLNKDSAIFNLTYIDSKFKSLEIIPCRIEGKKKTVVATGEEYEKIVEHIKKFSKVLGTELIEENETLIYTVGDELSVLGK